MQCTGNGDTIGKRHNAGLGRLEGFPAGESLKCDLCVKSEAGVPDACIATIADLMLSAIIMISTLFFRETRNLDGAMRHGDG